MTKDVISTNKNNSNNSNFVLSNGFGQTKFSNFNQSKTSKFISEKEKTNNTFFKTNTKYGGFFNNKPSSISIKANGTLPDIRKKFGRKLKENLNLSSNVTNKTTSNNFYNNRINLKEKTFSNSKPSKKINDSVPKNILESILDPKLKNRNDLNMNSDYAQKKSNNIIVNYLINFRMKRLRKLINPL